MKNITSGVFNISLILSLCVGSAQAGVIATELRDFVPVVLLDREELNKQMIELQKCTGAEGVIPFVTGAVSGVLYARLYKEYKYSVRYDGLQHTSRWCALEGALTGIGIHMAKQVIFRAFYGHTEKAKAINSVDTFATLAAFLGFNKIVN